MLTRDAAKNDALKDVAAALVVPAVEGSQFPGGIKPWNRFAVCIQNLSVAVATWPSLGIGECRDKLGCIEGGV
jgi:hypothetical protein